MPSKEPPEEGIPVTSPLVVSKCSPCHRQDGKGNLTRISWERTTPEGLEQILKRMVRIHKLTLSSDEARAIVKYLSNNHGLAPKEAKGAMYQAERRMLDEAAPSETFRGLACHAMNTADDVNLGPVEVEWSPEEFYATYGDDDTSVVGSLSRTGVFAPAGEGPDAARTFGRNNYGDVWVVATYRPKDAERGSKPLTARSYLAVTIPLHVRWDQPEVAE